MRANLKAARLAKGLTQKQLAEKVGLKRPAITKLESGLINGSQPPLRKLAAVLRKPVDHLWQLDD